MKPIFKHLIASAIGTGVVIAAVHWLPIWVVAIIVFGVLYFVAKNNFE